jgi:hypothetical protein
MMSLFWQDLGGEKRHWPQIVSTILNVEEKPTSAICTKSPGRSGDCFDTTKPSMAECTWLMLMQNHILAVFASE